MIVEYWNKDLGRTILVRYILTTHNELYEVISVTYNDPGYIFTTKEGLKIPDYEIQALGVATGAMEKIR